MDCSLPGSSVHGIFQARVLEWGAWWILSACEQRFQSCCYGKWPQGSSMSLLLVTGGTRALGKVLFLDCQLESNVLEEICKVYVPYRLSPLPLCPGHIPVPAPLCGKCFHHRWGDPKEGSWRWEHHHWRHGAQGACQSSSSLGAPPPLGTVGVVSLQEVLPVSGSCGPVQRGTGMTSPWAGLIGWHILPTSLSPRTVQPSDSSLPRLQGCGSSPGH